MDNKLTFLGVQIDGHPLIEDGTTLSTFASQKVQEEDSDQLTHLIGRIWKNNSVAIVGKNATGKTTLMKLVIGTLSFLLNGKSIEQTRLDEVLQGENPIKLSTYLFGSEGVLYKDEVVVQNIAEEWQVREELILKKKINATTPKNQLFVFQEERDLFIQRKGLQDDVLAVLAPDDSIFRMVAKNYQKGALVDTFMLTNNNMYIPQTEDIPSAILAYLDPSVEYLTIGASEETRQVFFRLKFKHAEKEIVDNNFAVIENYLSSGTVKGIVLYDQMLRALKTGGIVFVDELENHFNHAIARTFIEYFEDSSVNKNNATIIFSTHYAELLDEIDRGDQIFVARRDKKITLTRYSDENIRADLSKTDVFNSDNMGGTSPSYNAYIELKKETRQQIDMGE